MNLPNRDAAPFHNTSGSLLMSALTSTVLCVMGSHAILLFRSTGVQWFLHHSCWPLTRSRSGQCPSPAAEDRQSAAGNARQRCQVLCLRTSWLCFQVRTACLECAEAQHPMRMLCDVLSKCIPLPLYIRTYDSWSQFYGHVKTASEIHSVCGNRQCLVCSSLRQITVGKYVRTYVDRAQEWN